MGQFPALEQVSQIVNQKPSTDKLFEVLILNQRIQGILETIANNSDLDIDECTRNAIWGVLGIVEQSLEIMEAQPRKQKPKDSIMQPESKSKGSAAASALSTMSEIFNIVDLAENVVDDTEKYDQVLRAMKMPAELAKKAAITLDESGGAWPQESKALELKSLLEAMAFIGFYWNSIEGVKIDVPGLTMLAKRLTVELQDELLEHELSLSLDVASE